MYENDSMHGEELAMEHGAQAANSVAAFAWIVEPDAEISNVTEVSKIQIRFISQL